MGRRADIVMSEAFLAANRARMDDIGPWEVIPDPFNLNVLWRKPPVLQDLWVPLNLAFRMDSESDTPTLDPDERMFSLWEMFLAGRDEFLAQVRAEAATLEEEWGPVERGRLAIGRPETAKPVAQRRNSEGCRPQRGIARTLLSCCAISPPAYNPALPIGTLPLLRTSWMRSASAAI